MIQTITKLDEIFNSIKYDLIVSFQFHMKSSTHVISQEASR
jgi:hypothetical protein